MSSTVLVHTAAMYIQQCRCTVFFFVKALFIIADITLHLGIWRSVSSVIQAQRT